MAVYPIEPGAKIELTFVSERIYLRRKGTTNITVDVLVRNSGDTAITCLRVLLPYPFVDIRSPGTKKLKNAACVFKKFRKRQARKIHLASEQLRNPPDGSNWIYRTLPHIAIDYGAQGTIELKRLGQDQGTPSLDGYVKRNWRVESPRKLNEWMWFILVVNEITMVDLVAPQFEAKEPLQSSESMWVRLEFTIPADLKNDHSLLSRLFSPSLEYHQWYSSQEIILDESQRKITAFALNELTRDEDIRASLHEAKKELPKEFPGAPLPDVKDWRLFLYREYGLSVEKIEALAAEPKKPAKREIHYLPLDAYPRSRLGWAPSVLYRIFRRKAKQPRVASCHEFWIGTEHRRNDPKGYGIGLSLRLTNDFLIWAGGAALIVSIVHFLAHRFHWFGLH